MEFFFSMLVTEVADHAVEAAALELHLWVNFKQETQDKENIYYLDKNYGYFWSSCWSSFK